MQKSTHNKVMRNGIINIYKEAGFTSHDVVAKLRGILHQKKIGHTGTLDPAAVGVLPVCLGKATKLCDMIGDWKKTYEAVMLLGVETDTEDTTGQILSEKPVEVGEEALIEIMNSFLGDYDQVPPMYSAKKQNGKKLYELARAGITVERKPCRVHIFSLEILSMDLPYVRFRVTCSKGTYIRSLCRDIGIKAGTVACMKELKRTDVEAFHETDSLTLAQVEDLRDQDQLDQVIVPIDAAFADLSRVDVISQGEKKLYNGNALPKRYLRLEEELIPGRRYRVYDWKNQFIGVYDYQEETGELKPYKLFFDFA
ncbi:MAG: tRNA pseudouridine(55) synthase TruB [Lachnospiraceae bacterium]|nr:tRNA pseudouridine(55) synthase TruB [Lachnospiraceae bacterium]